MSNIAHQINVAVGVITKDNLFFVCRRKAHQHQGNKWEFPGGKVDEGETVEQALFRELKEEIAIDANHATFMQQINFTYPDNTVSLHVFLVDSFEGIATGAEGQESSWVTLAQLTSLDFPDANQQIISTLIAKANTSS